MLNTSRSSNISTAKWDPGRENRRYKLLGLAGKNSYRNKNTRLDEPRSCYEWQVGYLKLEMCAVTLKEELDTIGRRITNTECPVLTAKYNDQQRQMNLATTMKNMSLLSYWQLKNEWKKEQCTYPSAINKKNKIAYFNLDTSPSVFKITIKYNNSVNTQHKCIRFLWLHISAQFRDIIRPRIQTQKTGI